MIRDRQLLFVKYVTIIFSLISEETTEIAERGKNQVCRTTNLLT